MRVRNLPLSLPGGRIDSYPMSLLSVSVKVSQESIAGQGDGSVGDVCGGSVGI